MAISVQVVGVNNIVEIIDAPSVQTVEVHPTELSPPGPKGDTGAIGPKGDGVPSGGLPVLKKNMAISPVGKYAMTGTAGAFWGDRYGPYQTFEQDQPNSGIPGAETFSRFTVKEVVVASLGWHVAGNPDVATPIAQPGLFVVSPGKTYTVSHWVRASINTAWHIGYKFADASAWTSARILEPVATLSPGVWTRVSLTMTVPENSTRLSIYTVKASTPTAPMGATFDATGLMFVEGSVVPNYFDGDTPGARWTGEAHKSASELVAMREADVISTRAVLPVARNLIPNPSFETTLDFWQSRWFGPGATGTAERKFLGNGQGYSFRKTWAGAPSGPLDTGFNTGMIQIVAGRPYIASSNFRSNKTQTTKVYFQFFDAAGNTVGPVTHAASQNFVAGPNAWGRAVSGAVTAPAGATFVSVIVGCYDGAINWAAGDWYEIDNVMLEEGTQASPYFDGESPGAAWSSIPHLSKSELLFHRAHEIRTSSGVYAGTGFPEGKVVAPVGSRYIDEEATNGAVEWIKYTGTGSTGWRVSNGDTGWRAITTWTNSGVVTGLPLTASWAPAINEPGGIYARRCGSTIEVQILQMQRVNGSIHGMHATAALPDGMRPSRFLSATVNTTVVGNTTSVFVQTSGQLSRQSYTAGSDGQFAYAHMSGLVNPNATPWPASLPGTAA